MVRGGLFRGSVALDPAAAPPRVHSVRLRLPFEAGMLHA